MEYDGLIAIHLGAGYHSVLKKLAYEKLIRSVCKSVRLMLNEGKSATDCVCEAIRILEDSPLTNAGFGSNLTFDGKVECDASVMQDINLDFGAVGAISNIKNPVLVAKALLNNQKAGTSNCGMIPPCILAGEGAKVFAMENGFDIVTSSSMISCSAAKHHLESKKKLERMKKSNEKNNHIGLPSNDDLITTALDTVGAICIDMKGNISSAISSGGIILKHQGRLGQAAAYGAGCWAQKAPTCSVGVTTSGVGEYLIKTLFAQKCAQALIANEDPIESVKCLFINELLNCPFLKNENTKLAGGLMAKFDSKRRSCELIVIHSTATMYVGYLRGGNRKVQSVMSKLSPEKVPGCSLQVEGILINL